MTYETQGYPEMARLILKMRVEMKRWPTEEEVARFILGTDEEKLAILNG